MNRNWNYPAVWAEQLYRELTSATESGEWDAFSPAAGPEQTPPPATSCDLDLAA